MRRDEDMRPGLPKSEVGTHWGEGRRRDPSAQTTFSFDAQAKVEATQIQQRALFAAAVRLYGGVDALTAALNREPSYAKKISDALNGYGDRKIQWEWFAPMLDDPKCSGVIAGWVNEYTGHAPPVKERRVTEEQEAAAAREVIREMPEPLRSAYRQEVARRLGVRVEELGI